MQTMNFIDEVDLERLKFLSDLEPGSTFPDSSGVSVKKKGRIRNLRGNKHLHKGCMYLTVTNGSKNVC